MQGIIGVLLDFIAKSYYWVWHKFFQRDQPFTAQASRMEARWPTFVWGFALLLFYCVSRHLWLAIPTNLFAVWFLPHIVRYRVAHPENTPYSTLHRWAERRLGCQRRFKRMP